MPTLAVGGSALPAVNVRSNTAAAQFVRYVVIGVVSNAVYFAVFVLGSGSGTAEAVVAAALLSTVIANELHRRVTFRAADRVSWFTAQRDGGGTALIGLAVNEAVVEMLQNLTSHPTSAALAAWSIAISAVVGGLRFFALRTWVFDWP